LRHTSPLFIFIMMIAFMWIGFAGTDIGSERYFQANSGDSIPNSQNGNSGWRIKFTFPKLQIDAAREASIKLMRRIEICRIIAADVDWWQVQVKQEKSL